MKPWNAMTWTAVLLCSVLPALADGLTIPNAKQLANDQPVTLTGKIVTYASTDFFYIEEDSRCMGIRVENTAQGLTVGMRADVTGTMKTKTSRERYILATTATQTPEPNANGTVAPVGMNNVTLGGGDWHVVGTGGQRGATEALGLNNIGLLVRTSGRFYPLDATTFEVEDGAGLFVKCAVPTGTFLYAGWEYVAVTGISSMFKYNNYIYLPEILVRDVEVSLPVEAVSVPGTPSGNQSPIGNISETYSTTGSACSQGHPVEYSFNWGDGNSSPWSTSTTASHSWNEPGTRTVTVTARCQVHTSVSATSTGLAVNVGPCEMIYIPAGEFLMGNNGSEGSSYSWELPQHLVTLSDYYIGKYEVTRGEYRAFMTATGHAQPYYWDAVQNWGVGSFTQTDNHPVVGVTWYDAEAFCTWAGGHLPTEAQWERAARWDASAPTQPVDLRPRVYPWGNTWDAEKCNNWNDSLYPGYQTAPVGSYASYPSPSGCQDMAGNVYEWCRDWYGETYYSTSPTSDPQGPASGSSRVVRGGGWDSSYYHIGNNYRCASRYYPSPSFYFYSYGFRLAR